MPSSTDRPPIQVASSGFCDAPRTLATAFAVSVASVIAWGVSITSVASVPSSCSTVSTEPAKRSGVASPSTSTGFPDDHDSGSASSSRRSVSSERSASTPPPSSRASAAITPGPPAFVTIARRGPLGGRSRASSSAVANTSAIRSTRTIPARSNAASKTVSSPAIAPVWETAALADAGKRPAL